MADIRNKVLQVNAAVVLTEVANDFASMANKLKNDLGVTLEIDQSYKSAYEVIDELKAAVRNKNREDSTFTSLLTNPVSGSANYQLLRGFLEQLPPTEYLPPLREPRPSIVNPSTQIYYVPYFADYDPRRTARLVIPKPTSTFKSNQVKKWLFNNGLLYGFLPYADYALYYVGYAAIKQRVQQGTPVAQIISTYQVEQVPASIITVTNTAVLNGLTPTLPTPIGEGEVEYLIGTPVTDNSGGRPTLAVIDNKVLTESLALAFNSMKQAAAQDGVTISISSGFRPAFGPSINLPTTKGRQVRVTTQESLRRDTSRWSGRANWTGDDQSFVMQAPSSYFSPQTARPGVSNHGNGIAIDLNTGSRRSPSLGSLRVNIYVWLINNAHRFGFVRTIASEEWHFEYRPNIATNGPYASLQGTDQNGFYSDLGLTGIQV